MQRGLLIVLVLALLGGPAATARPLVADEVATLQGGNHQWQSIAGNKALDLAASLGRERNLDAIPILLEQRSPLLMNRFVNACNLCDTSTPQFEALALSLAQDKSYESDDDSWDTRSQLLRMLHDYHSRELFDIFYDAVRRGLIAMQARPNAQPPLSMRSIGGTIYPRSVPNIEEPLAALLPLLNDACGGYGLIVFLRDRHYVPALERLRNLYVKTPLTPGHCADEITYTLASFQTPAATEAVVSRIHWLLQQPQSPYRDQELTVAISTLGAQRLEAQVDLGRLEDEVLSQPMQPSLHTTLEALFKKQMATAQLATSFTSDNLLHWVSAMNVEIIRSFLGHGVNVNASGASGETPLTLAATIGDLDIISVLVEGGTDVNAPNRSGRLPLHIACDGPSVGGPGAGDLRAARLVAYLLAHGARTDAVDTSGDTALHHAAMGFNVPVLDLLLAHGADVNAKKSVELWNGKPMAADAFVGATPLHFAVRQGHLLVVNYLLDHGANINAKLDDGTTPLLIAVSLGKSFNLARPLVARGADVRAGTRDGVTPILMAHENQDFEMESLLRSKGAILNPITLARRAMLRAFAAALFSGGMP